MKALFSLLLLFSLTFIVKGQDVVFNIFNDYLEVVKATPNFEISVDYNSQLQSLRHQYDNNLISEEDRKNLYIYLLYRTDVREWDAKLKAIVLYKLIQHDKNNEVPAYKLAETGRTAIFHLINMQIKEEFAFIETWKESMAATYNDSNITKENIELTDEQRSAAIQVAYDKLVSSGVDMKKFSY